MSCHHNLPQRLVSCALTLFTGLCLVIASERHAWAYVDPGSGLLALQSIATILAGYSYIMRRRIIQLFGHRHADADSFQPTASRATVASELQAYECQSQTASSHSRSSKAC
jgi:hypothetical protein